MIVTDGQQNDSDRNDADRNDADRSDAEPAGGTEPVTAPPAAGPKKAGKKGGGRKDRLITTWRRRAVAAAIATVVFVAAFGVALFLAVRDHGRLHDARAKAQRFERAAASADVTGQALAREKALDRLRDSAASTAQAYAIDFSTYDYRHLDADFAKVNAHLTPSFQADYTKTSAQLKPIVVQYRGVATASVQGVGVTSVSDTKAVVVVLLDQRVTNSNTTTPRIDRNRLVVTLQRTGDSWLMSGLELR